MTQWGGKDAAASRANEFRKYEPEKTTNPVGDNQMPPSRIERTLRKQGYYKDDDGAETRSDPKFARIYSFSYEGHFYTLPRPVLFLVTGDGVSPNPRSNHIVSPLGGGFGANKPETPLSFQTKFAGVAARDWTFSDDIKVWAVDRKDLAVCLDIEVANYQELLLSPSFITNRGAPARGDMTSRGDMTGRGSFRGDMIGPHQG